MSPGRVRVDAAPGPFDFDPRTSAVLVVDMQNDFGSKGGMFERAGIEIAPIRAAIAPTSRILHIARAAGMPVVYLKMAYREDLADLGAVGAPNRERHLAIGVGRETTAPDGRRSRVLIRDTWSTAVVDELAPQPGDLELYKTRFSGFYDTALDSLLRQRGIESLVVTGCTTSICVESTVRDAMFRDYACLVLEDCSAEPIGSGFERTNHEASLLSIQTLLGWVSDSMRFQRAFDVS